MHELKALMMTIITEHLHPREIFMINYGDLIIGTGDLLYFQQCFFFSSTAGKNCRIMMVGKMIRSPGCSVTRDLARSYNTTLKLGPKGPNLGHTVPTMEIIFNSLGGKYSFQLIFESCCIRWNAVFPGHYLQPPFSLSSSLRAKI